MADTPIPLPKNPSELPITPENGLILDQTRSRRITRNQRHSLTNPTEPYKLIDNPQAYLSGTFGRVSSLKTLKSYDVICSAAELYKRAFESKDYSLCHRMREDAKDRAFGKPNIAGSKPQKSSIPADKQLAGAINTLIGISVQKIVPQRKDKLSGKLRGTRPETTAKLLNAKVVEEYAGESPVTIQAGKNRGGGQEK